MLKMQFAKRNIAKFSFVCYNILCKFVFIKKYIKQGEHHDPKSSRYQMD